MCVVVYTSILVTAGSDDLEKAITVAKEIGLEVLGPSEKAVNGKETMLICPDGNMPGWDEGRTAQRRRSDFIAWLRDQAESDHSSCYNWVVVSYGNCLEEDLIGDSSIKHYRNDNPYLKNREVSQEIMHPGVYFYNKYLKESVPDLIELSETHGVKITVLLKTIAGKIPVTMLTAALFHLHSDITIDEWMRMQRHYDERFLTLAASVAKHQQNEDK